MTVPLTSHCTVMGHRATAASNGHIPSPRPPAIDDGRSIVVLDIDNTLYSKHTRINDAMQDLIQIFFEKLGFSKEEANDLHSRYYKQYGLSIRGLIKHQNIDPLEYDRECDASLPLEHLLKPNPSLRSLLSRLDASKARLWALTNAYRHHAERVLRILDVADLFEAVISCDYGHDAFRCKPELEYFREAQQYTGVSDPQRHYFVDDSALNVVGARRAGWTRSLLFDEDGTEGQKPIAKDLSRDDIIGHLDDLPDHWPELFLPATT